MLNGNKPLSLLSFFLRSGVITLIILLFYFVAENNYILLKSWESYTLLLFLPSLVLTHKFFKLISR